VEDVLLGRESAKGSSAEVLDNKVVCTILVEPSEKSTWDSLLQARQMLQHWQRLLAEHPSDPLSFYWRERINACEQKVADLEFEMGRKRMRDPEMEDIVERVRKLPNNLS
jgi:hypothetical protein